LSLAKRIIESYHNGKISVKSSKPNEGTTFTIQLPLVS
jgi:two-component system, sporulation sensor kinase D